MCIECSWMLVQAAWIVEDYRPSPVWPAEGNVSIEAYSTRYRPGLDLVLKAISANIKGGEKVRSQGSDCLPH